MDQTEFEVIVIGGSAAGLSAALMLGRSRRRVLVIDAGSPRNRFAAHIHSSLGAEGVAPADLLQRGRDEVEGYGVRIIRGTVERVEEVADGVDVVLTTGSRHRARALIVASGMTDELPDVPGLAERWGSTALHCPYCHGWEVRDQRLGVLTSSPLGLHQAQLVRQWSDDVTVFTAGLGRLEMADEFRLRSRGLRLVAAEVVEVLGEGGRVTGVRTADGEVTGLDALFVAPVPRPHDEFLSHLDLARTDTPMGSFLEVDPTGRTSSPRIWAAGNVADPAATVPVAVAAGAKAGGAVNAALVAEEFDRAVADRAGWPEIAPVDYWEHRYGGPARTWSGRVNTVLAAVASGLTPGRALDLGSGEGADVIWLAEHGWDATGVDISASAAATADHAAREAGVPEERARFIRADLADLGDLGTFELVTASFLHSPVALARQEILSSARDRVAPGGRLLITSHVAAPRHAELPAALRVDFPGPEEEVRRLDLDPALWEVEIAEVRTREVTARDGSVTSLDDSVVLVRRR